MRELDETDLEILRALMDDARRPWAEVAERVGLSPPAVSDRVDRLKELGVIRRFTLDLDRSKLREGVPVLVTVDPTREAGDDLRDAFRAAEAVENLFTTAAGDVVCYARVPEGDVPQWLSRTVDPDAIADYEVTLLTAGEWTPSVGGTGFALACAECGNTVTSEGTTARIGGDVHQFCCPSCEAQFESRYERLDAAAKEDDGAK